MLCDVQRSVLLVIDAQTRLLDAMHEAQDTSHGIALLCQAANLLAVPVIATEQYPKGLGHTDTAVEQALPAGIGKIEKTCFSCCGSADFVSALHHSGREQAVLTGVETHVCVLQTALELQQAGKQVFVIEDAVSSRQPQHKHNALQRLRQAGVIVSNRESLLFEWLRDARHAQFKAVTALIR